jgi:hypothetical protein
MKITTFLICSVLEQLFQKADVQTLTVNTQPTVMAAASRVTDRTA